MAAPKQLLELVERFKRNLDQYKNQSYNETQVRVDYIDPFFELLGWDVYNRQGYAEQYREVVHEDKVKVGKATKAPDYSFRVGGVRKFFLEAKKPSIDLKGDIGPAFQVRRYAWSAGLPLSILTDFEEFAVYDCRVEPHRHDKSSVARVMYYTFDQYPEKWDEIVEVFSKDELLKGSFDRFAQSTKKKRGTAEVDDAFLAEIEEWREMLAKNIALRNMEVTTRELNHAVQRTIDRIIFLRIAEDRGAEPYGQLQSLQNGTNVYRRLVDLYYHADNRYNSGLFHFHEEKGRSDQPDEWTTNLDIDDKPLKEIFRRLYYPESPYEFSVLPGSILGQVYERFLGNVIRLTKGHQAKVEAKPEVRKAGGVFYTPEYITRYIVEKTVGNTVEGKKPKDVEKITILDPACGSGSFLLTAYDYLLDWHLSWYTKNNPEKWTKGKNPPIYQTVSADPNSPPLYRLTTRQKKQILLNNIYGVDIDTQAVEVTKLSLLLRVLEDEDEESLSPQLSIAERVLPDLSDNIKCGNSLVGSDIYHETEISEENTERLRELNPFDWQSEFLAIIESGGFDVVIGNPPYVRQESLKEIKGYLSGHYETAHGTADLFVYFIEGGYRLLNQEGYFGYIVANKWMRANYGKALRKWMAEKKVVELIDFGDLPVFQGATTYPCILILKKVETDGTFIAAEPKSLDFVKLDDEIVAHSFQMSNSRLSPSGWTLMDNKTADLLEKLKESGTPLGEYVDGKIYYGIKTGLNEAFVIDAETRERLIAEDSKSEEIIKPFLRGRDIKRYQEPVAEQYVLFARRGIDINEYPAVKSHLIQFRDRLMPKPKGWKGEKWKGRKPGNYQWYELQDAIDYYEEFEKPKIAYAEISTKGQFIIDRVNSYFDTTAFILGSDSLFLLGVLNSKLWTYLFSNVSSVIRGGFLRWKRQYMAPLTIPIVEDNLINQKDQLEFLTQTTLNLHKQHANARTTHDKTLLNRQIEATDKQIDRLVYELYGLSDGEMGIVERR